MSKTLSERSKKIVDNTIDKIRSSEMSVGDGYNKFVSNMFGGKAYCYFIDRVIELNIIKVDDRGMWYENSRDLWKYCY
jgi:hypothetical protein